MNDVCEFIDHPSGYLALSSSNQRFFAAGHDGFIAYREQGRHLFMFGGVHARGNDRGPLLDRFLAEAKVRRRGVVAVQLRMAQAELFASRGFVCNRLGTSYGLRLDGYTLAGTRRMKLRNKIRRARSLGVRILEVGKELPFSAPTFSALAAVSESWLRNKGKKELDFMIGELGGPEERARRIFVAVAGGDAASAPVGRLLGFITYVPVFGERPGYLHDLTRRVPDAPPGTLELCNAEALVRLRGDGAAYLHFGFTPFIQSGEEPPASSRVLSWLLRLLARHGRALYPAQSQADYKLKWGPDLVESELVAARPLSLRAIVDLLILTRSI
jgi:lysylphosphatidylglycerol synthetase-like protein (DUF2156 family)